jgi:peptidyl-prolyl cis-trans isomerase C
LYEHLESPQNYNDIIIQMRSRIPLYLILSMIVLTGCKGTPTSSQTASPASPSATGAPSSAAASTPLVGATASSAPSTPTPTPPPPALKVNGEIVPLAEFQASLQQLAEADPQGDAAAHKKQVLDALIDETLLAQAAFKNGFSLDESALDKRIAGLAQKAGGDAALSDWQKRMGYTPESFRSAIRRAAAAAWQRDQIAASVPDKIEQVHARQIRVNSQAAADQVESQARQAGTDFATLAFGYDQAAGGDLSWFPRGYLNEKTVEDAAFALKPGEISPVVQSSLGFHVIQVIAREVHPLSPDARAVLQRKALADWLANSRSQSQVENLVP